MNPLCGGLGVLWGEQGENFPRNVNTEWVTLHPLVQPPPFCWKPQFPLIFFFRSITCLAFFTVSTVSSAITGPHTGQVVPHPERLITSLPPAVYTSLLAATPIHYLLWSRAAHSSPLSAAASFSAWAPSCGRARLLSKTCWLLIRRRTWFRGPRLNHENHLFLFFIVATAFELCHLWEWHWCPLRWSVLTSSYHWSIWFHLQRSTCGLSKISTTVNEEVQASESCQQTNNKKGCHGEQSILQALLSSGRRHFKTFN